MARTVPHLRGNPQIQVAASCGDRPQLPSPGRTHARRTTRQRAQSSCVRRRQLHSLRLVGLRSITQNQVAGTIRLSDDIGLFFSRSPNDLSFCGSCRCVTHPLRGWGRAPQAARSPLPTPRGLRARAVRLGSGSRDPPGPLRTESGRRRTAPPRTTVVALATIIPSRRPPWLRRL